MPIIDLQCKCFAEFEEPKRAFEATLADPDKAILGRAWVAAARDRDVANALPAALKFWAIGIRQQGNDLSANAADALADRMASSLKG